MTGTRTVAPIDLVFDIQQEVRFAVVMYGGVSLAVYINGVAQELLRLVRATATDPDDPFAPFKKTVSGSEAVYRRLGQILTPRGQDSAAPLASDAPVRTRFVVDVLSGTSAGGINAVFLAKALANGQDIDALKHLWISEGDIEKLVNDRESVRGVEGLTLQKPPRSLLNSQRMYRRLFEAFEGMERVLPSSVKTRSPYADQVDLFVTTTDIVGLPVQLRLADAVVEEKRHRNVFHLRYSEGNAAEHRNDFHQGNNAFLAFASRCTSAFPFAFEPMRLSDIASALTGVTAHNGLWASFFPAYREPTSGPGASQEAYDYTVRAFGDGGYLDNKPFSYATSVLSSRRAGVPVDRKLIYIEPSPEAAPRHLPGAGPNAFENVISALSLARYETIREDLERILERNRLLERVERILSGMEMDVKELGRGKPPDRQFGDRDLLAMTQEFGVGYGGYHRVKVAALTDEITGFITRAANFDPNSDQFLAIRYFVRVWRDMSYTVHTSDAGPASLPTQNRLLMDYDLSYRLRRITFVLNRLDQLFCLTAGGLAERIWQLLAVGDPALGNTPLHGEKEMREFRATLRRLADPLNAVAANLRKLRATLLDVSAGNPLAAYVSATKIDGDLLRSVLDGPTEKVRHRIASALVLDPARKGAFLSLAGELARIISAATEPAKHECHILLGGPDVAPDASSPHSLARSLLSHYYHQYDLYDLISFPILHATQVGEEIDAIDVLRVSPRDAPTLIDELHDNRRKLAGTTLMNFGAFLDRGWRENDVLWGRLDGAERLISTLLPSPVHEADRRQLIREAQVAILAEELVPQDADTLCQLLTDALGKIDTGDRNEAALREFVRPPTGAGKSTQLQGLLRSHLSGDRLWDFFKSRYEVNRALNPKTVVRTLARATQVVGLVGEHIADEYRVSGRPAAWVARLGRVFWGLIEVAVPRSIPALIFGHWLRLLYLFEALLIVGGIIFGGDEVQRFGIVALFATGALHLITALLADFMRGRVRLLRTVTALIALLLIALALLGGYGAWQAYSAWSGGRPVWLIDRPHNADREAPFPQ